MTTRRFIGAVLGCATLAAILVAAINFAVDPYLLFDRPPVPGFNAVKPAAETHEPMMKVYQASRLTPSTLIVGSSRTDIGLDPASPAWPEAMRPVYNFSVVGTDVEAQLRAIQGLLASRANGKRPRTLILGLDFEVFLDVPANAATAAARAEKRKPAEEQAERFAALAGAHESALPPVRLLMDYWNGLLTMDALGDSIATVAASRKAGGPGLEPSGRLSEGRLRQWTETDGAAILFAQKNLVMIKQYRSPRQSLGDTPDGPIRDFAHLRALFDLVRRDGITLILVVQPMHAERLELLDAMGYWPDYERWKRELAGLAASARASGVDVTAWDFGGYEPPVLEPVPHRSDRRSGMQWFWDPVHYKVGLGNEMIAAFSGAATLFPASARLVPEDVEARLAAVRRDRDRYRQKNAEAILELKRTTCPGGSCAEGQVSPTRKDN
jgi:hypothetical protein